MPDPQTNLADSDHRPSLVQLDQWVNWREFTPARIALGRVGASQPTEALLRFSMAHAHARDAVYEPLELAGLFAQLEGPAGCIAVKSRAADRAQYLRRPDFGRRLDSASVERLRESQHDPSDLVIVIADGLSALATVRHAVPVIKALRSRLAGWRIGPIVIAEQARVALGDEVGEILNARCVAILIGERPGLSSPDSLGIYLTWNPQLGRTDAERNCISNIRPAGLSYEQAATKLVALLEGAKRLGTTGVDLKENDGETQRIG
jgi:ethanolamine ammonia-lyase small subunit